MSIERGLFVFAGILIMLTVLLAMFHHPYWAWFTFFIGFNMFQSAFSGFCPAAMIMKKMGMQTAAELAVGNAES